MHIKKQHIVPAFLLKNFTNEKNSNIWSFDKKAIEERWNNEHYRAISSTPTEDFFYDKIKGVEEGSFEYVLGQNETKVAPIFYNLITKRDINSLSISDKEVLALFICYQSFRTKERLKSTEEFSNQLNDKIEDFSGIRFDVNIRDLWLKFLENIDSFKQYMLNKTWVLAESNEEFYLSDNPVVLQNTTNRSEVRGTLGFDSLGIEIYVPLSSSIVLCLFCKKTVPTMESNIKCIPENIINLNWLQIINSTRFVFSNKNNFDL